MEYAFSIRTIKGQDKKEEKESGRNPFRFNKIREGEKEAGKKAGQKEFLSEPRMRSGTNKGGSK